MKQLSISPELVVDVNLEGAAAVLKPVVFHEGNAYCCILGPDPVEGVFGCGDTPAEAIADWDETLQLRLQEAGDGDALVNHVKAVLASQPKPQHIQAFYEQFRPVKK